MENGIMAIFHYVPLDDSSAGKKYSRRHGTLAVTYQMSNCVVRLPLWTGMTEEDVEYVIEKCLERS